MHHNERPAPGWYADPVDGSRLRYWDGTAWAAHTAPGIASAAPAASDMGPTSALHYLLPVGRSPQSVWAPYVGLVALIVFAFPFASLVVGGLAIWLSVAALRRAKHGGHGTGRAITALVLAGIAIILNVVYTAMFFTEMTADPA